MRELNGVHFGVIGQFDGIVFLADYDGPKSMTNAAEHIVKWANEKWPGTRVVYRDTEGDWGELINADGEFVGFDDYNGDLP